MMGRVKSGDVYKKGIGIVPTRLSTPFNKTKLVEEINTELLAMNVGDFTATDKNRIKMNGLLEGSVFYDQEKGNSRKDVLPRVKDALAVFVDKAQTDKSYMNTPASPKGAEEAADAA